MRRLLQNLMILAVISGCYTEKKAANDIKRADEKHPKVVSDYLAKHYPCEASITKIVHDTAFDFIEISCPDVPTMDSGKIDTVFIPVHSKPKTIEIIKKKIVRIPSETITITKLIKDSAEISSYKLKLADLQAKNDGLINNIYKKEKALKWLFISLGILLLIVISMGWGYLLNKSS